AGESVRALRPECGILWQGQHGPIPFGQDRPFGVPASPTGGVVDPAGAGGRFARGSLGYRESDPTPPPGRLRRAMAYGTVIASFTVEDYLLERLKRLSRADIEQRLEEYRTMLSF